MRIVKANMIPVINGATGTIEITYHESTKLRNYKKQAYWALHTYFGKY